VKTRLSEEIEAALRTLSKKVRTLSKEDRGESIENDVAKLRAQDGRLITPEDEVPTDTQGSVVISRADVGYVSSSADSGWIGGGGGQSFGLGVDYAGGGGGREMTHGAGFGGYGYDPIERRKPMLKPKKARIEFTLREGVLKGAIERIQSRLESEFDWDDKHAPLVLSKVLPVRLLEAYNEELNERDLEALEDAEYWAGLTSGDQMNRLITDSIVLMKGIDSQGLLEYLIKDYYDQHGQFR